jgi:hypothetical protein
MASQSGSHWRSTDQTKSRPPQGRRVRSFFDFPETGDTTSESEEATVADLDDITTGPARINGEPRICDPRLTVRQVLEASAFAAASLDDKILPPVVLR